MKNIYEIRFRTYGHNLTHLARDAELSVRTVRRIANGHAKNVLTETLIRLEDAIKKANKQQLKGKK